MKNITARDFPHRKWLPFRAGILSLVPALWLAFGGCSEQPKIPEDRALAAKTLFEETTKNLHLPSAQAQGSERLRLQKQAAAAYEQLLKKYPEQEFWAAQALNSLGNLFAAQTNIAAAVKQYTAVEKRYPNRDWEVLMAWKSAGDLLWEFNRRTEAKAFYEKILVRYDTTNISQVIRVIVRGSKARLSRTDPVAEK